jgi:hypothetical protein
MHFIVTEFVELRSTFDEVRAAGLCSHPIRLMGSTAERSTGELRTGSFTVACKDRRAAVCPACSAIYKADAWHLVASGLSGGKGVTGAVAGHPRLFVTVTAPSFGPVHTRPRVGDRPCRPRRARRRCVHGAPMSCSVSHGSDEVVLGEPLCMECFDYRSAVLWNAHVSKLWQRTTTLVVRALARHGRINEQGFRAIGRISYLKVAEFQRRGLIHLHVVVRADGPDGPDDRPPVWLTGPMLSNAVAEAVARVEVGVAGSSERIGWGDQIDIQILEVGEGQDQTDDDRKIAAYAAKYATKTSDGAGVLARPIRSAVAIDRLKLRPHLARLVRTAWDLGGAAEWSDLRLRAHAHTFGFPGHLTTKSIRYSTTFSALRQARKDIAAARSGWEPTGSGWHYLGRGYQHPDGSFLAEALGEAVERLRQDLHTSSQSRSPIVPQPPDQG